MEFDSILRITGRLCPYVVLSVGLCTMLNLFANVQVVLANFIHPRLDHWCHVHEFYNQSEAQRKYISIPYDQDQEQYESCYVYDLPWQDYSPYDFTNWNWTGVDQSTVGTVQCQSGWEYDNSMFSTSATSEWDLVCDRAWIHEVLSPLYMAGLWTGSLICGPLSDNFGRMKTMMITVLLALLSGLGCVFAVNEWMFMVFRYSLGIMARMSALCSVVISMEIITPEYRSATCSVARISFAAGSLIVAGAAYFIRDFRALQLALLVPLAALFLLNWLIPESPRWLMSKGRKAEARNSILTLARRSHTTVPDALLDKYTRQESVDPGKSNDNASVKDLFRTPTLLRWMLILGFNKLAVQFVYFAVTLNMDTLFGDIYLNTMLAAITEIPSNIIVTICLQKFGRKRPLLVLFSLVALGGIVSMGLLIADKFPMANTVTLILVRCAASGGVAAATSLSGELFPSAMRQTAVSMTSAISSLFAIFSPLVGGPMKQLWEPLPSLVFAVLSILAWSLCLLVPDTRGKAMPETIEEALALGRSNKKVKPSNLEEGIPSPVVSEVREKNGVIPSLTDPGIQVGGTFYPIRRSSGGFSNWAFEDEFVTHF